MVEGLTGPKKFEWFGKDLFCWSSNEKIRLLIFAQNNKYIKYILYTGKFFS